MNRSIEHFGAAIILESPESKILKVALDGIRYFEVLPGMYCGGIPRHFEALLVLSDTFSIFRYILVL